MSNEEIVIRIKAGETDLIECLYNQVKAFIRKQAGSFFLKYRLRCEQLGLTVDDLCQEGFIAILKAIGTYEPDRGVKFLTYFAYYLKRQFFDVSKMHSTGWQADKVIEAISLDVCLGETQTCWLSQIPDETSEADFDEVIERDFLKCFYADVEKVLESCTDRQAYVIRRRYVEGSRPSEIARQLGIKKASLTRPHKRALETLRQDKRIQTYREYA